MLLIKAFPWTQEHGDGEQRFSCNELGGMISVKWTVDLEERSPDLDWHPIQLRAIALRIDHTMTQVPYGMT